MDSEYLISKLLCHVFNHFTSTFIFQHLPIHSDCIKTFECEPSNAVFTLLDSTLSINVSFKVFLELLLVTKVILLLLFYEQALRNNSWFWDVLYCWVWELIMIDLVGIWKQTMLFSLFQSIFCMHLPSSCVSWVYNKLLWLVIIFKAKTFDFSES